MSIRSLPGQQAHVIGSEAEAIEVATRLAAALAPGAADRDRSGAVPYAELRAVGESGLLGITIPREYGGLGASWETVGEVFRILAAADPAVAQVPQNHYVFVNVLREDGTPAQREFFFGEVLAGARFGNALAERGNKNRREYQTKLTALPGGGYRLDGRKYYCTGAISAQWIPAFVNDEEGRLHVAYVERHAPGVTVLEDWTAMGQRATVSGSTIFEAVEVPAEHVVPHWRTYERPQIFGAAGQLLHAAIDVGIADNALRDAAEFVRTRSRPWFEAGVEEASQDPYTILRFGELAVRLHAAEGLLTRAGRAIDAAERGLDAESAGAASLAVAEAKAYAGDVAVEIANELFALAGTSATDERHNLHRHWRNARTHTLHDPNRWKYHHAGNYLLNAVLPPNHGLI